MKKMFYASLAVLAGLGIWAWLRPSTPLSRQRGFVSGKTDDGNVFEIQTKNDEKMLFHIGKETQFYWLAVTSPIQNKADWKDVSVGMPVSVLFRQNGLNYAQCVVLEKVQ